MIVCTDAEGNYFERGLRTNLSFHAMIALNRGSKNEITGGYRAGKLVVVNASGDKEK